MSTLIKDIRSRLGQRQDSEHQQILVRLAITVLFIVYVVVTGIYEPRTENIALAIGSTPRVTAIRTAFTKTFTAKSGPIATGS